MARWLHQILTFCLAIALIAGAMVPSPMAASRIATGLDSLTPAASADLATADLAAPDAAPCHGAAMAMAGDDGGGNAAPPAGHRMPACPLMACCIVTVPALPTGAAGIGAPVTAGTVLRLVLERAGDGHIPSPLPKIPRA
ncbi:hypothetical protein [Blastochloris viridis]|uniref:DUF2946 domain-containing protein n=1 Tax=Blastochloris viridis TaxID=1079 RepID=A0A0H5BA18_BLAVI|nr:hypothetical protein [Blastochloris viridis]ALK10988.1 hypothetical protein BVIR_3231 [Blastochloris viridis]BAR99025.1 hypothetical protein BV133_1432 [Blastochloris viridis]CUU43650.1 hypothetical protein BVIRIDIS_26750 [Blastochloris viridis]